MERIALARRIGGLVTRSSTLAHARPSPRILPIARPSPLIISPRQYSTPSASTSSPLTPPADLDAKERAVFELLVAGLEPAELVVRDVSGGCGSMYAIEVASERFRGLGMLAQQRLVNKVLASEIGGWHGVQVKTRVP